MKKAGILFFFILCMLSIKAQYANMHLKEVFDMHNDNFSELLMNDPNHNFGNFSDNYIESWQALLDMYRATGDKAYLIEFAKIALWVEKNRVDRNPGANGNNMNKFRQPSWYRHYNGIGEDNSIDALIGESSREKGDDENFKPPLWFEKNGDGSSYYMNGIVLSALTEFVYLVKNEYLSLTQEQIVDKDPLSTNYGFSVLKPFVFSFNINPLTLDEFATWLLSEIDISMLYFVKLRWLAGDYNNFMNYSGWQHKEGINLQGVSAPALYFYGKLRPTTTVELVKGEFPITDCNDEPNIPIVNNMQTFTYTELAIKAAEFYTQGTRKMYTENSFLFPSCTGDGTIYSAKKRCSDEDNNHFEGIFMDANTSPNSFKWRYVATKVDCARADPGSADELQGENEKEDFEDIGHANNTLQFLYRAGIGPNALRDNNNALAFSTFFMIKLHNTFTQSIVNTQNPSGCSIFNAGVDGDNSIAYLPANNGTKDFADDPTSSYHESVITYMPLQAFDGLSSGSMNAGSINVYNTIMDLYKNKCVKTYQPSGTYQLALSRVVKAQWEKECTSLTLYNRNLVYNQDFIINTQLVVDPTYSTRTANIGEYPYYVGAGSPLTAPAKSFADPKITTQEFTICPGVHSNMAAGEEIRFLPGFHVKEGATFHAYIQGGCTKSMHIANPGGGEDLPSNDDVPQNNQKEMRAIFSVYPNPNNGIFTLEYSNPDAPGITTVSITDMLGKQIYQAVLKSEKENIDMSQFGKGTYIVTIQSQNDVQVRKIIIE